MKIRRRDAQGLHGSAIKQRIGGFSYDGGDFGTVGVPREHQTPDGFACVRQSDGTTRICVEKAERLRTTRLLSY